ncbi:MAG: tetratricopeptide repeat protein [Candidatus Sulfotelmatobacter sp.]
MLVILLSFPFSLHSQGTASLHGSVRDSEGKPVAGAAIHLQVKDTTPAQIQTVHTDQEGKYSVAPLSGGVYLLRAEMAGYSDAGIPALFIGPHEAKNIDLTLLTIKTAESQSTSARSPEFFDEPRFTVAGVTDTTSLGGHGSDTIVRTRETIAKETVSLGKDPANSARTADYEKGRDKLLALLAQEDKAELHHSLGDVQEKLGDSLDAVREYQRAAELDPTESYLFDWGSELLLHHAPEPASEVFARANRLFPHSVRILIGLGAAWFARGSYDQAVQRICEASDLNPKDSMPYLFLGRIQSAETTTSEEVVEKLRRFVTREPQNAEANYYYAVSLWKQRKGPQDTADFAQIESLLRNAVRLDPKFAAAYLQLGILHSERKDYPRAISDYQQAIQANPQMPMQIQIEEAHFRLAQAYRQIGDTARAEAEIQTRNQIDKELAQEAERERHEIRQFVYTLRDQPPPQAP